MTGYNLKEPKDIIWSWLSLKRCAMVRQLPIKVGFPFLLRVVLHFIEHSSKLAFVAGDPIQEMGYSRERGPRHHRVYSLHSQHHLRNHSSTALTGG